MRSLLRRGRAIVISAVAVVLVLTAVVAFRLVSEPQQYFNTGTFVKRGGRWQAVAWQATKIPAGT